MTYQSEWQPMENLPKDGMPILANWRGGYRIAYRGARESIRDYWTHQVIRPKPTHWMPLPQPPKES